MHFTMFHLLKELVIAVLAFSGANAATVHTTRADGNMNSTSNEGNYLSKIINERPSNFIAALDNTIPIPRPDAKDAIWTVRTAQSGSPLHQILSVFPEGFCT